MVKRITRKNKKLESSLPLTISAQDGLVDQNTFFNKQVASRDVSNYYLLKNGEFAYNKSYSKDYPWGAVKRLDKYDMGVLSTLYIAFKPTNIESDYLIAYYDTDEWHKEVSMRAAEGARNHGLLNISAEDFFDTNLKKPVENDEQRKIGEFFKKFDDITALLQRKLEALQQLKKGLLQKMFPSEQEKVPQIRLANFNDEWEQHKFKDIVNRVSASSNSNRLPKVEFEDIISGEGRLNKDVSRKFDNRKGIIFKPDNILYGKLRPYLKNWLLPDFRGIALGDFWIFEVKNANPKFVYWMIQADKYQKVANDTSGTKMPRSDWKQVSITSFPIPTMAEQEQIGVFLNQIDQIIALHQQKIKQLKIIKKGLLQKMFI